MIHLVPLEAFPEAVTEQVCRRLYMAYGLGCEVAEVADPPAGARDADVWQAATLLEESPRPPTWRDDRVLYLVQAEMSVPDGPLGVPPAPLHARPDLGAAVATAAGLDRPEDPSDPEAWAPFGDRLARRAVQAMGFLWGLHRCVDPKCAMYPPWSPEVGRANADGLFALCNYCREKSEHGLRRARS